MRAFANLDISTYLKSVLEENMQIRGVCVSFLNEKYGELAAALGILLIPYSRELNSPCGEH